jgi:hypothetical protein
MTTLITVLYIELLFHAVTFRNVFEGLEIYCEEQPQRLLQSTFACLSLFAIEKLRRVQGLVSRNGTALFMVAPCPPSSVLMPPLASLFSTFSSNLTCEL